MERALHLLRELRLGHAPRLRVRSDAELGLGNALRLGDALDALRRRVRVRRGAGRGWRRLFFVARSADAAPRGTQATQRAQERAEVRVAVLGAPDGDVRGEEREVGGRARRNLVARARRVTRVGTLMRSDSPHDEVAARVGGDLEVAREVARGGARRLPSHTRVFYRPIRVIASCPPSSRSRDVTRAR